MTPAAAERQSYADLNLLRGTWASKPGLLGWLSATNHQEIGRRYIVTAFMFLLIGGGEALLMRLQLAKPENTLLTAERYNQIFTLHGTTMMFLFAVPVMEGMGITPQLLRVCQRLAAEGYAVAAPDLFWRFGGSNPEAGGNPYGELRHADGRADIVEAVSRLRGLGAATVGIKS